MKDIHDVLLRYWRQILKAPDEICTYYQTPLSKSQRCALAPRCHLTAPLFVRGVARALRDFPHLFPDIPIDPTAMLQAQERAMLLRRIRDTLAAYHQLASDAYLVEQGHLYDLSLKVIQQSEHQPPFAPPIDPTRRRIALTGPLLYLQARQLRKQRSQRRNQEKIRHSPQARKQDQPKTSNVPRNPSKRS